MRHQGRDPLRDVPPRDFVRARDALVAQLTRSGKTDDARRVRGRRRPSPVVWALNQAARARAQELRQLAETVDRLRRAQLGQGDLRAATDRYRAAFDGLVGAARDALRETGSGMTPAVERRLRSTLLGALTDRRLRESLAGGGLTDELADPGFAVLSKGPVLAEFLREGAPRASPAAAREAPGRGQRAIRRREERQQERASRRREGEARQAQRALKAAERTALKAEQAARAAERQVDALRIKLQERERETAARRAVAAEATAAYERAQRKAEPPPAGLRV